MNPDFLFLMFNGLALVCWLPLFIFPYHPMTLKYVQSFAVPIVFAIVYIFCLTNTIVSSDMLHGLNTLDDLRVLFDNKWGFLTGWVHYLCFDFAIGSYIIIGSKKIRLQRAVVIGCLVLCFMLGPLGFLAYRAFKSFKTRK